MYASLLTDSSVIIEGEFERWRLNWFNTEASKQPNTATTVLEDVGIFLPNISICLQIVATLPISTAQAERMLSTVDRNDRTATCSTSASPGTYEYLPNRRSGHRHVDCFQHLIAQRFRLHSQLGVVEAIEVHKI